MTWQPIGDAPHDGSEVWLRIEHMNFAFADDNAEERACWQQTVSAHWIDHNAGGFTWIGLAGAPTHWQPKDGCTTPSPELLQP